MSYEPTEAVKKFLKKILYEKSSMDLKGYEGIAAIIDKNFSLWPEECEYLKQEIAKIYGVSKK